MSQKRDRDEEIGVVKDEVENLEPPLKKRKIDLIAPTIQSFRLFDNFSSPASGNKNKPLQPAFSDSQTEDMLREIQEEDNVSNLKRPDIREEEKVKEEVAEEEMIEDSYDFEMSLQQEMESEIDSNVMEKGSQTIYSRKLDERDSKIACLEIEVEDLRREKKEWNEALKEIECNTDIILLMAKNGCADQIVSPPPSSGGGDRNSKKKMLYQTSIDKYIV